VVSDIRALTVKRPWAGLIAHHGKTVENRTWGTTYRGLLFIHAGQGWEPTARWFSQHLVPVGADYWLPERHPQRIVAVAELVGVCPGHPCECGPWAMDGQEHWRLGSVRALAEPVRVKGALGLWRPAPAVIEAVQAQLGASS
jgi:hypothetical protein